MKVTATCTAEAFDNQNTRHYFPGEVVTDFDTDNQRLTCLTSIGGRWVFQYPGHEGIAPNASRRIPLTKENVAAVAPEPEPVKAEVTHSVRKPQKSEAEKKAMGERMRRGREEAKARRAQENQAATV